jgi:hypothetical protein
VEENQGISSTAYIVLTLSLVVTFLLVMITFSLINAKMTATCCFKLQSKVRRKNANFVLFANAPRKEKERKNALHKLGKR